MLSLLLVLYIGDFFNSFRDLNVNFQTIECNSKLTVGFHILTRFERNFV